MIVDYQIVERYSTETLVKVVKQLIIEGWQPLGAPYPLPFMNGWYAQALVFNMSDAEPQSNPTERGRDLVGQNRPAKGSGR